MVRIHLSQKVSFNNKVIKMIGRIKYHKDHKGTDKAFSVQIKEKVTAMTLFDPDAYKYREVGRFKTLDEAEEYLLSRGNSVNYHGIKI